MLSISGQKCDVYKPICYDLTTMLLVKVDVHCIFISVSCGACADSLPPSPQHFFFIIHHFGLFVLGLSGNGAGKSYKPKHKFPLEIYLVITKTQSQCH